MAILLKPSIRTSSNQSSSRRDFFSIVLYCGMLGEQYGRQVHLFQKRTCVRKSVSYVECCEGAQRSESSGSDIPAFRPIHKSVDRWGGGGGVTIPLLKHTAALLETVPEPETVLSGSSSKALLHLC